MSGKKGRQREERGKKRKRKENGKEQKKGENGLQDALPGVKRRVVGREFALVVSCQSFKFERGGGVGRLVQGR